MKMIFKVNAEPLSRSWSSDSEMSWSWSFVYTVISLAANNPKSWSMSKMWSWKLLWQF